MQTVKRSSSKTKCFQNSTLKFFFEYFLLVDFVMIYITTYHPYHINFFKKISFIRLARIKLYKIIYIKFYNI